MEKFKLSGPVSILKLMWMAFFLFTLNSGLSAQNPQGGQTTVTGVVVTETGEELLGAAVKVMETGAGTVTDLDGRFALDVPPNARLEVSYLGYETKVVNVGNQTTLRIVLGENLAELDEVVVVAYGTQRKKDLTGSVSIVDTKEMKKMITPGIGEALQGLASGVSVTSSGAPGSTADIRIRGVGSFADVGPLYVIDGMIMDGFQRELNMADIESIQILKDAASASLYGSRGANGVIIVTTKRGKEGPTRVNFAANFGIQNISKKYDVMDSDGFLKIVRMSYENAGREYLGANPGDAVPHTDWQNAFFKTGFTQDYNVDISGGNQNGNYMFAFGYYDQDGTVKGPDYQRFTLRSNTEAKIGIFTVGENLTFGRSVTHPINGSPFLDLARMPPVIPVYDSNNESGYGYGTDAYPTYGYNPIALQELRPTTQTHHRFLGNGYVQMNPLVGLTLKSNIGIEYNNWFDHERQDLKQIRYSTEEEYQNHLLERKGNFLTWIWENTASYNKQIDKHKFDLLVGYSAQRKDWKQNEASGRNLTPGYWVLDQVSETPNVGGTTYTQTMASWLGRINYDYDGRYLVQLNIRRDGSSRFGANNRYGTFPSASLGWRLSEESFFTTSWVDDLKLRASYGVLGDQQALDNYAYDTYISTGEGGIFGGSYYPGKIQKGRANPDLKWETKQTLNLGVDFSLFEQRLYGTVEYYNSISKDLLIKAEMPWVEGTDESPWTNLGKVSNRGLDLTIGYRENKREFKYDISFNMSTLRNRLLKLDKEYREGGSTNINRSIVGRSMSEFWVLRTDGIFQNWDEVKAHKATVTDPETGETYEKLIQPNAEPGDIRYKDLNGDGIIDQDDRDFYGKAIPSLEFGLNFSAQYKNFDFNVFFAGVTGNKIYNESKRLLEIMDEPSNYAKNLKPWTPENPSTTTPRPYLGATDNTLVYSERWMEDGKYIRLKNIQVGYTLPRAALAKLGVVQSARVYVGAQNLFTITGYSGLDPEISSGGIFGKGNDNGHYPPIRTISAGIQMSF